MNYRATTLSAADVTLAADRIRPYVRNTPLLRTEVDGRPVVLKLEHLQRTGSFKLRGAVNALLAGQRPERVVTASGGNHGIAVATAASLLGLPATVYVPASVPEGKARRIESMGAKLIRHGDTYAEASAQALAEASAPGTMHLPAFDHPDVVAGQGTVAAEVVAEVPDVDTIAVAIGGGGLVAGTVLAADGRRVCGVEPENCRSMHDGLAAGRPVDSRVDSVAASALGATRVGEVPFAVVRSRVDSVLVSDQAMLSAQDRLWDEFRIAAEPAAAAPLAALLADAVPGELPCLVICGANTDWRPV